MSIWIRSWKIWLSTVQKKGKKPRWDQGISVNNYIIYLIYHTVNRLRSFLSSGHLVFQSSSYQVIQLSSYQVIKSSGHLVIQSSVHPVIQSSRHFLILSSCHLVMRSSGNSVILSSRQPIIMLFAHHSSHHHVISTCSRTNWLTHNIRIYRSASQTITHKYLIFWQCQCSI